MISELVTSESDEPRDHLRRTVVQPFSLCFNTILRCNMQIELYDLLPPDFSVLACMVIERHNDRYMDWGPTSPVHM